jgi:hypothetical protein
MRCVADGYPTPIYKWYKEEYVNNILTPRYIDPLSDNRITQTDGTLTIFNPQQSQDRGKYHCTAQNKFGIIISQTVQLSFGCEPLLTILSLKLTLILYSFQSRYRRIYEKTFTRLWQRILG